MSPKRLYNILVVEDNRSLAYEFKNFFNSLGHYFDIEVDGKSALDKASKNIYSLMIIDIGLPRVDGISILEIIRSRGNNTPIIILGGDNALHDELIVYKFKGNLYHAKPINFLLLKLQIDSLLSICSDPASFKINNIEFDFKKRCIVKDGNVVYFTNKEYLFIASIISNPDKIYTKKQVLELTKKLNSKPKHSSIDVFINRLRRKIEDNNLSSLIETVYGQGYRLNTSCYNVSDALNKNT